MKLSRFREEEHDSLTTGKSTKEEACAHVLY
jgi:hypothetical protein